MKIPLTPNAKQDKRVCAFCNGIGDMTTNGPGRYIEYSFLFYYLENKYIRI